MACMAASGGRPMIAPGEAHPGLMEGEAPPGEAPPGEAPPGEAAPAS